MGKSYAEKRVWILLYVSKKSFVLLKMMSTYYWVNAEPNSSHNSRRKFEIKRLDYLAVMIVIVIILKELPIRKSHSLIAWLIAKGDAIEASRELFWICNFVVRFLKHITAATEHVLMHTIIINSRFLTPTQCQWEGAGPMKKLGRGEGVGVTTGWPRR